MDEENKEIEINVIDKTKEEIEKIIQYILDEGIQTENLDFLYKAIDIHKDIENEEYWKIKKEDMEMRYRDSYENYGEYGEYGNYNDGSYNDGGNYGRRGVPGTGRGRYRDGSYGRRGVPGTGRGRYRGEEAMDEMAYHYGNYSYGREQYGADEDTMKSFKYMLKAFKDYYKHLKQEASSQQEVQLLEETAREMMEM